jgi:hypothetical protein
LNPRPPVQSPGGGEKSGAVSAHLRLVPVPSRAPECTGASSTCSTVAGPADDVAASLEQAMEQWMKSRDRAVLRRHLLALLMLVEKAG